MPWQELGEGGLAELGLTVAQAQGAAWWVDSSGGAFAAEAAVAKALQAGHGWRRLAGAGLLIAPVRWLAAPAYRTVARHRHRLPGSSAACRR